MGMLYFFRTEKLDTHTQKHSLFGYVPGYHGLGAGQRRQRGAAGGYRGDDESPGAGDRAGGQEEAGRPPPGHHPRQSGRALVTIVLKLKEEINFCVS